MLLGYILVDEKGNVVKTWGGAGQMPPFPNPLVLPNGNVVAGAKLGESYDGFILSEMHGDATDPVPQEITRRQCALQLLSMGLINGPDAVEMVRNGTPPQYVKDYFVTLPEADRYVVEIDFAAQTYLRSNPLLALIGGALQIELDNFFREASKR